MLPFLQTLFNLVVISSDLLFKHVLSMDIAAVSEAHSARNDVV